MRFNLTPEVRRRICDGMILATLAAFTLRIRWKTLEEVEGGGDALTTWYFVRQWFYGVDFSALTWDHHMARLGITLPAFLVQYAWGSVPTAYYVAPMLACVGAVLLTYKMACDWSGPYAGVAAGIALAVFPPMERAGSQLLPGAFAAMYVALGAYALLRYCRSLQRGTGWIVVCAMAMFLGYLSHEPCVFFLPGFGYGILLYRRSWRQVFLFPALLLVFFCLETLWYRAFTQHSSRLALTLVQHGPGLVAGFSNSPQSDFWTLFDRYDRALETSWKLLIFSFLAAGAALTAFGPKRARGVLFGAGGFLVCVTFAIAGFNPLTAWLSFQSRYLMPLAPIACAAIAVVAASAVRELLRGVRRFGMDGNRVGNDVRSTVGGVVFALLATAGVGAIYEYGLRGRLPAESGWKLTQLRARDFADAFERGLPFTGEKVAGWKAVRLAWGVYLPDDLVVRGGKLPRLESVVSTLEQRVHWFAKDRTAFGTPSRAQFDRNQRCLYRLAVQGRFLAVRPAPTLPGDCSIQAFNVGPARTEQ